MEPKDVIKLSTVDEFNAVLNRLNLSSRQRKVFLLKYSYLLRIVDIAEILDVHQDTISQDIKTIREKLKTIASI